MSLSWVQARPGWYVLWRPIQSSGYVLTDWLQMMATWLAKCGVDCRIVDKRNSKIFNGQADGELHCMKGASESFREPGIQTTALSKGTHLTNELDRTPMSHS
jgi:hypothetical protein